MATLPHDLSDLYLAPVALALDARIAEWATLDVHDLATAVAIASDTPDRCRAMREDGLRIALSRFIDCREWVLSWDPRGLRLTHGAHTLVLGVPAVFVEYLVADDAALTAGR